MPSWPGSGIYWAAGDASGSASGQHWLVDDAAEVTSASFWYKPKIKNQECRKNKCGQSNVVQGSKNLKENQHVGRTMYLKRLKAIGRRKMFATEVLSGK